MNLEEYKRYLAMRIEREVLPLLFPRPAGVADRSRIPPPHPLPWQLHEDAKRVSRYGNWYDAKRIVLEGLRYIRENKRGVDEDLRKRLRPPIYITPILSGDVENLEEGFIESLKAWAMYKAQELKRLQFSSENVARHQQEDISNPLQDPRLKYLALLGPAAMIIPPIILELIGKHNLHNDPDIRAEIQKLEQELLQPPEFMRGDWYVNQLPPWYLRALYESWKRKKEGR